MLDKSHRPTIEWSQCQNSGNANKLVKGIGLVSCVYVNPGLDQNDSPYGNGFRAIMTHEVQSAIANFLDQLEGNQGFLKDALARQENRS